MAKFAINASGAMFSPSLGVNFWVRCASGNVLDSHMSHVNIHITHSTHITHFTQEKSVLIIKEHVKYKEDAKYIRTLTANTSS